MFKKIAAVCTFFFLFLVTPNSFAEVITLKSQRTVTGKIVNQTGQYIDVDVGIAIPIRFYFDEIDSISEEGPDGQAQKGTPKFQSADGVIKGAHTDKKAFIWRIKSPQTKVYVMGSIHLGKADMYPLPEVVEKAYDESDILTVEVNIFDIDPLALQAKTMDKALYKGTDKLERHLSKETIIKLRKRLRKYNMYLADFSQYKPWFVGTMLAKLQIKALGFSELHGVDLHFLKKAKGKKRIDELETLDFQLGLFDNFPAQDELLDQLLVSVDDIDEMVGELIYAWQEGDADAMYKMLISDSLNEHPHFRPIYDLLFFDRNKQMAEKIKGYLDTDKVYFVVVGAGHVVGKEGIVELLKRDGFSVQQL